MDKIAIFLVIVLGFPLAAIILVSKFQPVTTTNQKVAIIEREIGGTGRYLNAYSGRIAFRDNDGQKVWVSNDGYLIHADNQKICLTRKVGKWIHKVSYTVVPPSLCLNN